MRLSPMARLGLMMKIGLDKKEVPKGTFFWFPTTKVNPRIF